MEPNTTRAGAVGDRVADMQTYYGRVLGSAEDLQSNVCTVEEPLTDAEKAAYAHVHPDVTRRSYGCGAVLPPALAGARVLDIGCGTGRDAFALARLVGEGGRVTGLDVTREHIDFARSHVGWHMRTFGHTRETVEFLVGSMEDLAGAGLEPESFDVVVSNCVINLSADKGAAFSEILRVLAPGGELYFSDVFADRRLPPELRADPVLVGECIGDVMYRGDFHALMGSLGVGDVRRIRSTPKVVDNARFRARLGPIGLFSELYRVFKLPLERKCEDYGQAARYRGTIPGYPDAFVLDEGHVFETGRAQLVCGNTAMMLSETRYGAHFDVLGDRSRHFGVCGAAAPVPQPAPIALPTATRRDVARSASPCCG